MAIDVLSYVLGQKNGGVDPSGATALAGDILHPKKAVLADGQLTEGTIPSQAAQTIYPSTQDQTIAAGKYLSGAQTVKGVVVSNTLIPANVADGVTVTIGDADDPDRIMEVVGTHQGGGGDADLDAFVQGTLQALVTDAASLRNYAAHQNTGLTSVSAPEATSVGQYAFQGCSNLASASFAKATSIGDSAFNSLSNLASVNIPLATSIGASAFYSCIALTFTDNELLAKTIYSSALYNAARGTESGFAWRPIGSGATVSSSGFYGAKVVEVDGGNVTRIDNYAFYCTEWLADADFGSAVITTLGNYAFQNAGKRRADLTVPLLLDFHSGTFSSVQQYTFAGLKNTIITLPTTVTSLAANAFNGIDGCIVYITRTASAPTLSATTVFASASNSFVALPYDNLYTALQNANWNAISSMVVGFAPAGTFTAGDTLPTTDSGSHDIYWSTDPAGAQWVVECPAGSPVLYAHLGSKTGWYVDVDVTGATISIVGSDSTVYPIVNGRATLPRDILFDINVTYPSGYDTNIILNNVPVSQFPITNLVANKDYTLNGIAYDPGDLGVDWATDSWETIKNTATAGLVASTYGSQVGATRNITLTDSTVVTLRLANADDTLYDLASGAGTRGMVVEFQDCYSVDKFNSSYMGTWPSASTLRTVTLPSIYALLPSDVKDAISIVNIKTAPNGSSTITTTNDELIIPAWKEISGLNEASAAEDAVLTQWQYYAMNSTREDQIKKFNGTATDWWTRTNNINSNQYVKYLTSQGYPGSYNANVNKGVSPAFVI